MADKTILQLDEDTGPTIDDFLASWDVGTGASKKVSLANIFALLRNSEWYEELGRTTLGSPASSISVASFTAKKYLRIIIFAVPSGGTVTNVQVRLNNDSGNNYARRTSTDGGADATGVNSSVFLNATTPASGAPGLYIVDVLNVSAYEKLGIAQTIAVGTAGAGTAPTRNETMTKWVNTSSQITRVDAVAAANNFAAGSEVVVLGHN